MKTLAEALNIIGGSKQYDFSYNEDGSMSVLTITDYHTGDRLKLDLSRLDEETLAMLQVRDEEDYTHSIVISEQVDIKTEDGSYRGTDELSVPVSQENCERPNRKSFYCWLCALYPQYDWQYDDGEDWDENPDTDYCQYTAQIDENDASHIYLAAYNRTEKE